MSRSHGASLILSPLLLHLLAKPILAQQEAAEAAFGGKESQRIPIYHRPRQPSRRQGCLDASASLQRRVSASDRSYASASRALLRIADPAIAADEFHLQYGTGTLPRPATVWLLPADDRFSGR